MQKVLVEECKDAKVWVEGKLESVKFLWELQKVLVGECKKECKSFR